MGCRDPYRVRILNLACRQKVLVLRQVLVRLSYVVDRFLENTFKGRDALLALYAFGPIRQSRLLRSCPMAGWE